MPTPPTRVSPYPRSRPRKLKIHLPTRRLLSLVRLILPLLLTLILILYLTFSQTFRLTTLNCHLNSGPCNPLQQKFTSRYLNRHLFTLRLDKIRQDILAFDPNLKSVQVSLTFPNKITINLSSETALLPLHLVHYTPPSEDPLATSSATSSATPKLILSQVAAAKGSPYKTIYLTPSGEIQESAPTPLTITLTPTLLVDGTLPDSKVLGTYYTYIKSVSELSLNPQLLWFYRHSVGLVLADNLIVLLNSLISPQSSLTSLQQIRSESTIKLDRAIVDLRFNNPVILYQ